MIKNLQELLASKTNLLPVDIHFICHHFKTRKTKRNEILIDYKDICNNYYFINKGAIRLFTINREGIETSRYFAFENMFCTALPSFIDQKPACEYLQTIAPSSLLVISREDFYKLVNKYSEFDKIYREILELGFILAQKRIYGFQGFNALEKVQWLIANQPNLLLRVSNKMAASYLGISPATLSRAKAKL